MSISTLPCLKPQMCDICRQRDNLLQCSSCQLIYYCSEDHQASDRQAHEAPCEAVRNARLGVKHWKQQVETPVNDDKNYVSILRDFYHREQLGLADTQIRSFGGARGSMGAVEDALGYYLHVLRHSDVETPQVRPVIPPLYIRLGQDQEAYDFLRWFATCGLRKPEVGGRHFFQCIGRKFFMAPKNRDVLEPIEDKWPGREFVLDDVAAVMLIKIRAWFDLRSLQNILRGLRGALPNEIIRLISRQLVGGALRTRPEILQAGFEDNGRRIEVVKAQIRELYKLINRSNPHFWRIMLDDPWAAKEHEELYSLRSSLPPDEAAAASAYGHLHAWNETSGALDTVRDLRWVI